MFKLWWIREDKQGSLDMGTFPSEDAAEEATPLAKTELLKQCGSDADRDEIGRGTWRVTEGES